ncbi:MAG: cell division ATP-binding protein FtsE [Clostridia bacterium]|nr:cell division ATP-binding protein FtsE [Clostridia bacterium]
MSANTKPLIEFRGVYKAYDNGTKALADVNLKIDKGEFVFVVGASGAGKSTFIKLIIHEEKPNAGEIRVGDFNLTRLKRRNVPKLRRTMGIVFQDFRLIRNMTVFDNVAFAMRVVGASKRDIRKRVSYALNIVGLNEKARNFPDELSGGEQQRVALARALVNNPTMIIADEPTGNVDPTMSYEIVDLLTEINKRGTTVIMVTHEHQLVRDFGHRVVMIENGQIVADNAGLTETAVQTNAPLTLQTSVFDQIKEGTEMIHESTVVATEPVSEETAQQAVEASEQFIEDVAQQTDVILESFQIDNGFVIQSDSQPKEDESHEA